MDTETNAILPLALAVAILKLKPRDCSIRVYIDNLREKIRVRDETLKNTSTVIEALRPSGVSGSREKRTSSDESILPPSKRTMASSVLITPNNHLHKGLEDFQAPEVPDYGNAAVHHIWQAHKSYEHLHSDPSLLAHHLSETSHNLAQHITTVLKNCREQQSNALSKNDRRMRDTLSNVDGELQRTQRAAGKTFASLLHGLTTLDRQPEDSINALRGAVTYSYLQSFDTLLSVMSMTISLHTKDDDQNSIFESIPSYITTLLLAIISLLDSKQKSHRTLFEGIMYLLLERVGKHLYFFTFNKERGATIEEDIQTPCSLSLAREGDGKSRWTLKHRHATTEAKYIIQLLERAMSLAPPFLGSTLPIHPNSLASKPNEGQAKLLLTLHAKEKLQRTLVHAMFGDDGAQREFVERLKKPVAIPPVPAPPNIRDKDVPQWFREKIWGLVGWDILAREGDW